MPPPRLLVVLAHPDDEVLALGARLERLALARLVTVTDGAPEDGADARQHGFSTLGAYREARAAELAGALRHAGLPAHIAHPFPALPPVPDQRAAWHLEEITRGLAAVLDECAPEAVLTHPYEGGHPDHDACAFAVHAALRLRAAAPVPVADRRAAPLLLEAPFYHAGGGRDGDSRMRTGTFLDEDRFPALCLELSSQEQENKRARLACFPTQADTLRQFGTERECFRRAPAYDFSLPPHRGKLLYEYFPWGMTGSQFRALAGVAESRLFGDGLAPEDEFSAGTAH